MVELNAIGDTRRGFLRRAFGAVALAASPPIVTALHRLAESDELAAIKAAFVSAITSSDYGVLNGDVVFPNRGPDGFADWSA